MALDSCMPEEGWTFELKLRTECLLACGISTWLLGSFCPLVYTMNAVYVLFEKESGGWGGRYQISILAGRVWLNDCYVNIKLLHYCAYSWTFHLIKNTGLRCSSARAWISWMLSMYTQYVIPLILNKSNSHWSKTSCLWILRLGVKDKGGGWAQKSIYSQISYLRYVMLNFLCLIGGLWWWGFFPSQKKRKTTSKKPFLWDHKKILQC